MFNLCGTVYLLDYHFRKFYYYSDLDFSEDDSYQPNKTELSDIWSHSANWIQNPKIKTK